MVLNNSNNILQLCYSLYLNSHRIYEYQISNTQIQRYNKFVLALLIKRSMRLFNVLFIIRIKYYVGTSYKDNNK